MAYGGRKKFVKRKRKYVRKKTAPKKNAKKINRMKYTNEIKSLEMTTQTYTLQHQAKVAGTAMANGVVIPIGLGNSHMPNLTQGTGADDLVGVWHMPRYCVSRYIINWSSLTAHAHLNKGLELRCRYGVVCNTGHKHGAALTSNDNWCTDINKMIHNELQDSGLDDNFLTFSKRNRAIKLLGDFMVKPKLANRVADVDEIAHGPDFAPPKNIQIDWHKKKYFPRQKQRMTSATDCFVPNNTWQGFIYFSSNNITAEMGSLDIHTSCKYYFSDP